MKELIWWGVGWKFLKWLKDGILDGSSCCRCYDIIYIMWEYYLFKLVIEIINSVTWH